MEFNRFWKEFTKGSTDIHIRRFSYDNGETDELRMFEEDGKFSVTLTRDGDTDAEAAIIAAPLQRRKFPILRDETPREKSKRVADFRASLRLPTNAEKVETLALEDK